LAAGNELAAGDAVRGVSRVEAVSRDQLLSARALAFRWALVRTGDADQAEDVAQEVSIRLARRPPEMSGGAFRAWLYRATVNLVVDLRRSRWRTRPADDDELASMPAPTRDALDALVGAETRATLQRFVETLSARQRELIQLVDVDGYSAAEAAGLVGIDAATARVHLLRARRALRKRLLEEGELDDL
jgi:RNA polymerase sigma-70 factor (ECF subfamily)